MTRWFIPLSLLVFLGFSATAEAQQQYIKFSSGTGFFINRDGHVITNAHVVRDCESIAIRGNGRERPATLVASDKVSDLAVLKIGETPADIAPLRWNISDLRIGDAVFLYGFPGEQGAQGKASFVRTTVQGLNGPAGEPEWLQLASVAQQGNSGGPVLDASGNVIAVIAGRAETYRTPTTTGSTPELVGKADIAITLSALQDFLDRNQVPFYQMASGLVGYADPIIAENAHKFIVPVRCVHGTITQ